MTVTQTQFRDALLDASKQVPKGLHDAGGAAAGARFSVYRNNVIVSLTEAMTTAFPLVRKLIGAESFAQLAAVFVRAHPPSSPLMMFYGEQFPTFLETFQPLAHIGYLADCARLDLALRQSYHAADAPPPEPQTFAAPEAALEMSFSLAPASIIVRSAWPLYDIWRFNMEPESAKPRTIAQDVLITRPDFDPVPHELPLGGAAWLERLHAGSSLAEAANRTQNDNPEFDLTACLTLALSSRALTTRARK